MFKFASNSKEVYVYNPDWLSINNHPITEQMKNYIVCDEDKNVFEVESVSYNSKGKPIYNNRKITHWIPMPRPPK